MASMKVILTQDIENLGFEGQEVRVAAGYYRNFLGPRNLAAPSDSANAKWIEAQKAKAQKRMMAEKERAKGEAKQLSALQLTAHAKCGDNGRLFGSITTQNIADLLAEQDFVVDRRKISTDEQIKRLGNYTVTVRLFQEVEARFKLHVIGEDGLTQADIEAKSKGKAPAPAEEEAEADAEAAEAPAEEEEEERSADSEASEPEAEA